DRAVVLACRRDNITFRKWNCAHSAISQHVKFDTVIVLVFGGAVAFVRYLTSNFALPVPSCA
ncbi:MAG: hypothetical protein IKO26_04510, partial [Paludibacteraceae bacterium]|nr:hypothetical protein [Paludibacteraceae bacterium]